MQFVMATNNLKKRDEMERILKELGIEVLTAKQAADSRMTLANFFRAQLFSTMASLRIGMNILTEQEKVRLDVLMGHGGLFKTKGVGQRLMAGAMNIPRFALQRLAFLLGHKNRFIGFHCAVWLKMVTLGKNSIQSIVFQAFPG